MYSLVKAVFCFLPCIEILIFLEGKQNCYFKQPYWRTLLLAMQEYTYRAPLANLGLWDYILFEIGITEISFEIGIMDIKSNQIGVFHPCKLGLGVFTLFGIRLMGLHRFWNWDYWMITGPPPYGSPLDGKWEYPNEMWWESPHDSLPHRKKIFVSLF